MPPASPVATGLQRKFINPTPGWVGANVFGPDGKPTAVAVEPGGEVWLTEAEERMTAEAPRAAQHNPFVMEWEEVLEYDQMGQPSRVATRSGTLVVAEEPPRPIASDRFIPARLPEPVSAHLVLSGNGNGDGSGDKSPEPAETITGAPPLPEQPPVQGQPSPEEVVGTPEATAANAKALSGRKATAEQPTTSGGAIPV